MCYIIYTVKKRQQPKERKMKMKFVVEKVANMVFISSDCGVVFNAWDETEVTERKINNAMKRISKNLCGNAEFERKF